MKDEAPLSVPRNVMPLGKSSGSPHYYYQQPKQSRLSFLVQILINAIVFSFFCRSNYEGNYSWADHIEDMKLDLELGITYNVYIATLSLAVWCW